MAEITLVNIPDLAPTTSNDPELKFAVDVPSVGLKHINYKDLFIVQQKFVRYSAEENGVYAAESAMRSLMMVSDPVTNLTIVFPATPKQANTFELRLNADITNLTINSGGRVVEAKPTSNTGITYFMWVYEQASNIWFNMR